MEHQISRAERIRQIKADFSANNSKYRKYEKKQKQFRGMQQVVKKEKVKHYNSNRYVKGFCLRFSLSILLFLSVYLGKIKLEEMGKYQFEQVKITIAKNNLLEEIEYNAQKMVEEKIIPAISQNGMTAIQ